MKILKKIIHGNSFEMVLGFTNKEVRAYFKSEDKRLNSSILLGLENLPKSIWYKIVVSILAHRALVEGLKGSDYVAASYPEIGVQVVVPKILTVYKVKVLIMNIKTLDLSEIKKCIFNKDAGLEVVRNLAIRMLLEKSFIENIPTSIINAEEKEVRFQLSTKLNEELFLDEEIIKSQALNKIKLRSILLKLGERIGIYFDREDEFYALETILNDEKVNKKNLRDITFLLLALIDSKRCHRIFNHVISSLVDA